MTATATRLVKAIWASYFTPGQAAGDEAAAAAATGLTLICSAKQDP